MSEPQEQSAVPIRYSFDQPFQMKILALMARDPKFMELYEDVLRPSYFSVDMLSTICRLVLGYWTKYKTPPTSVGAKTLMMDYVDKHGIDEQLAGELWGIIGEMYCMDLSDANFIKDKVVEFGRQMAFRQALMKSAEIARDWGELDRARGIMDEALAVGQGIGDYGLNLYSVLPLIPSMYRESNVSRKVRTGWPTFDRVTGGGLGGGELGFICGGSGQGKSTILVNFAGSALEAMTPVIYITHELSELDVITRIASRLTGLPETECRSGSPRYDEVVAKMIKHTRHLRVKYMHPGSTPAQIRSFVSIVSQLDGIAPGLIIDDYADELMRSDRKSYGNRYEDMGLITSELIVIAKDFKCPLWTASQMNRGGFYNENAGSEGVSDSFQKIMKADAVLVLQQTREQKAQGIGMAKIDKLRRGVDQKMIPLRMDYERMLVVEDPTILQAAAPTA